MLVLGKLVTVHGWADILNNQETNRTVVSAEADERTRFELYYRPFEGAIKAGVGSMMCS